MHQDTDLLINEVGHQVATHLFSRESFYDIATTHRRSLETKMTSKIQHKLDELQPGVELLSVNFKDVHPLISVADSYEEVIAGFQEKKKFINDALGYHNKIIPESRGDVHKLLEESRSYIIDRTRKAEGAAKRFSLSVPKPGKHACIINGIGYFQIFK